MQTVCSAPLRGASSGWGFKMQKVRFRLDSKANFLTEREALERLTHYLNFTGEPQEAIVLSARTQASSL